MGNGTSTAQPEPEHTYARQARLDGHATPLAKALHELDKPNSWLAREIGVHRATVGRWVKGVDRNGDPVKVAVPPEMQGRVARAVRVRKAELFE